VLGRSILVRDTKPVVVPGQLKHDSLEICAWIQDFDVTGHVDAVVSLVDEAPSCFRSPLLPVLYADRKVLLGYHLVLSPYETSAAYRGQNQDR